MSSAPQWKSEFSTNYQVKKGITTEQSLEEIEEAAKNGVQVKAPAIGSRWPPASSGSTTSSSGPAAGGASSTNTTPTVVKVPVPNVTLTDGANKQTVSVTSAIRHAAAIERGEVPVENRGEALLRAAQERHKHKPPIDLTK